MALEVIGGIASILQLAGTVYTISKTLYEVGEALSNAPSDIKDLARDLETFSEELRLLSTLLHGKDGRYADQVYRLTAKIIGDCATICTKIDRIIRKLRSGSVLAKIKWLYKEKEIMKLLARLRDLKLSLMGTLSVLSALRADNMMDSLGINNPSLIGGPNRHGLSTETRMQVEDTRLKLAGMSMKDTTGASLGSKTMLSSSASLVSGNSSSTLSTSATSTMPSATSFSASSLISMAVMPNSMPPILNTQANQSVDSFHSALSYQNQDSQDPEIQQSLTPTDPSHALSSSSTSSSLRQPTPLQETTNPIAKACHECIKNKRNCDGKELCNKCLSQSGSGDGEITMLQLDTTHGMSPSQSDQLVAKNTGLKDICDYGPLEKDSGPRDGDVKPTDEQMKQVESFLKPEDSNHAPVIPHSVMVSDRHSKPSFSAEESRQLDTSSVSRPLLSWRNEMALSAMKHFNMTIKDAEEWANNLPIPSNLSAIMEPTVLADILPHPENANKPQKLWKGRLGAGWKSCAVPLGNPVDFQASMGFAYLKTSTSGSDNDELSERDHPNCLRRSGTQKPQYSSDPLVPTKKQKLVSIARSDYSGSDDGSTVSSDGSTDSSVVPQQNQNFTAVQTKLGLEMMQQHQKLQSSTQQTQQTQQIQTQHQQQQQLQSQRQQQQQQHQQQQQQQMARLSPHRHLETTDKITGVDVERWCNVDALPSIEIPANMPSGFYELETGNLLPKPQPQEIQMQSQESQEAYKRDEQSSYPSISPCGKSEPRRLMDLPPDYTDDISGQAFNSPKSDTPNNMSTFHCQNEVSIKGLGGFWFRGLINVQSFNAVTWSNLQQYLNRERVYTTSEAVSNPFVANSNWSASLYKERIALRLQMLPRAASSIQKIFDVIAVIEDTIGLKIGAIAWACLLGAVENLLSHGPNWTVDSQIRIITEMSGIVSIIARYTVMENIYAQWKGMSLDKDYEQSLINLSTHVLIYLGAFVPSISESSTNADMKPYFDKIIEADTVCRGFTVIVSAENTTIDRKRSFQEFSDDSDDTDDSERTILGVDVNDEVNNMPSSAKRIKL
ncbi:putative binuclear zinc transcription factor protein [Botrytis fragariae]|uniref:Putative binuclear zinc transcription factor protein n=1 Tax=Botrytis fragariae TaxID=1964551 RepID=A0A8H6ARX6_9HELO|nr:putative binuclear zinc transcription factor protein [Botrytis fragariae]KAF5872502.1 putative binuclear zinc transcription factor protein [Botrytis fragariae]